jgi:hypothetical protein
MSISGILSSSFLQKQLSSATTPYQQDMQKLSQDLQTGNLTASQSDFAALQAAFSQSGTATASTSSSSSSTSNPVAQAFNQLGTDLQSGNLSAAQKDFSTVQQDLQSQGVPPTNRLHHHHHIGSGGGSGTPPNSPLPNLPAPPPSLLQDLNQVGQNLTSSNLAGAQQAYATLQQELQQFALGGGTQSSTLLAQPPVSLEA